VVHRTRLAAGILAAGILACGKGRDPAGERAAPPPAPPAAAGHAMRCEPLPFAESTPVPEASGAAWLSIDGKPLLLVVGDSGNHGAYGIVDPETGATIETGALPLSDEASDDIEGLSAIGDRIYGLTSSGWVRVWRRQGKGFELIEKPYPLGPVDLPDTKSHDRPPASDGMVCGGRAVNCGRNYEGLCLAPAAHGGCIGLAASKADGHLYCLTEDAGKLAIHRDRAIAITRPGALADCTVADDGAVWAASNLFDISRAYRVTHWEDPAAAQVELIGPLPIGFPELIAVRGDIVYRMSDMGVAPSLMARFRCRR
jgi:outer membrane protein assembly factor BamB